MKKKIIICVSLLLAAVLSIYVSIKKNTLYDQLAADRWTDEGDMAQISLFYPVRMTEQLDSMHFTDLSHRIQNALDDSAYSEAAGKKDKTGLSFPYSVSVTGEARLASDSAEVDVKTYGVEGDFFTFHPLNLLSGSYLSPDDIMEDGVILDEDAAWKLFGSYDIAGQTVVITGVPHIVKGVVRKEEGTVALEAGLDGPMCYMSLDSLTKYGRIYGSYTYEMILPNPVEGFAKKTVSEVLGKDLEELIICENSKRFTVGALVDIIRNRKLRSMSTKGVVFPFYENIARSWEDTFSVICLAVIIILGVNLAIFAFYLFRLLRSQAFKNFKKRLKHNIKILISEMIKRREYKKQYEKN